MAMLVSTRIMLPPPPPGPPDPQADDPRAPTAPRPYEDDDVYGLVGTVVDVTMLGRRSPASVQAAAPVRDENGVIFAADITGILV